MQIDAIGSVKRSTEGDFDTVKNVDTVAKYLESPASSENSPVSHVNTVNKVGDNGSAGQEEKDKEEKQGKDPTKKTIDSMMSEANQRMGKTRCEYSYDEPTKRVSIKVFDKDTDELIREVPPEKSLEMLQKMWELAGLIVDEKR